VPETELGIKLLNSSPVTPRSSPVKVCSHQQTFTSLGDTTVAVNRNGNEIFCTSLYKAREMKLALGRWKTVSVKIPPKPLNAFRLNFDISSPH
jgi:hypothetical protein